jgi:Mn2+/Fe2+ NRAMP family transporter
MKTVPTPEVSGQPVPQTVSQTDPRATDRVALPEELALRLADRLHVQFLRRSPSTLWNRLLLGLTLIGPGILVMLGDNDAGGVVTYMQTGATYGIGLFLPLMIGLGFVAYLVQEMTIRLGAVTKRGHAEMIWKRYGPFWGAFSLFDLVVANVLTLMTEFIGIRIAGEVFGWPYGLTVPLAALFVILCLVYLRYWTWERLSLLIAAFNLVFVPIALLSHPDWTAVAQSFAGRGWIIAGGFLSAPFLILISANIGTTIAPWQLFFQQSCVVDKGLVPKDIDASRRDLIIGVVGMVLVAMALILLSGQYIHGQPGASHFDIQRMIATLQSRLGYWISRLFALGLLEAGLIASIVITASSSWAIGEAFDIPRSLNARPKQAWGFYTPGILSVAIAGGIVLLPHLALGFLNLTVQVVATIFMPAAMLFLLMLLNDRELMGDYVNSRTRNVLSIGIMVLLIVCNTLYGIAALWPHAL